MRVPALRLALAGAVLLGLAATGRAQEPAPDSRGTSPAGPALPPVAVRLLSLGTPERLTLRADSPLRLTDAATGERLDTGAETSVTLRAAGGQVRIGERRVAALRVEAPTIAVEFGGTLRLYPEALRVRAAGRGSNGGLQLVNECSLEAYTAGVLAGECPALFHPEAIRAIAIAVRTYSYRRAFLSSGELCDTTHCQVYRGIGGVRSSIREAVEATRGLCALYDSEVIEAVYSADCGGYTAANEEAWPGATPLPYLRPVEDAPEPNAEPFCAVNRSHRWTLTLSQERLRELFGARVRGAGRSVPGELTLEIAETSESGRARRVRLAPAGNGDAAANGATAPAALWPGEELRRRLGPAVLRSLRFSVRPAPPAGAGESPRGAATVELEGTGWGHGVGLCQFGANGMARQGIPFDAILKHYYTGIEIAPAPTVEEARARLAARRLASGRVPARSAASPAAAGMASPAARP